MNAGKQAPSRHSNAARQQKAMFTENEARRIIEAEALARIKKTEKLKALRLQQAAAQGEPDKPPTKKKK